MGARPDAGTRLRGLPAVHELAGRLGGSPALAVPAARQAIGERREALLAGIELRQTVEERARELVNALERSSLGPVINATGVVLHTNLGRAPLAHAAREAVTRAAGGYVNLELDLATGDRGSRHRHVEALLCQLTGGEAAMVVNNGAAAVLLAVAALAGPGARVIVSRGQLIEIGGGFRIPDVVAASGARLIEVGTTNRTRLADYELALTTGGPETAVLLRVHQSNFRTVGFVEDVAVEQLSRLGAPVIDDLGSGLISDPPAGDLLADEPSLPGSLQAGATLVCCSGDKLLGGPQAGIIIGARAAVAAARTHPLARALRIDKLSLAGLEATLRLYRDPERARREIPVLAMLEADQDELAGRAQRLAAGIGPAAEVVPGTARVGGGALPLLELKGPAVALEAGQGPDALAAALRAGDPPVIARIGDGRLLLDPRTISDREAEATVEAVRRALAGASIG